MNLHAALTPPKQRDVSGMKLALARLTGGDHLSALLASDRYGAYLVEGVLYENAITQELYLGGDLIAGRVQKEKGRDGSEQQDIRRPTNLLKALRPIPASDTLGAPGELDELEHGDLVVATLTSSGYGTFRMAALVTTGETDDFLLAGRWIIRQGGSLAKRADSVELIDKRGTHPLSVPAIRVAIVDEEGTDDESL